MVYRSITISNPLGMHARAAARFVRLAGTFGSQVQVRRGERTMDGKSILGLLLLAAGQGSVVTIAADGVDEAAALEALCNLIERGFSDS